MVLKVVRGKILETLELRRRCTLLLSILEAARLDRLSKNAGYLIDNLYESMLSQVEGESKRKAAGG
jgi:hypothetical protein